MLFLFTSFRGQAVRRLPLAMAVVAMACWPWPAGAQTTAEKHQLELSNPAGSRSEIREIILLRHGNPMLERKGWFTRKEAEAYDRQYDKVGVHPPHISPLLGSAFRDTLLVSAMPRAVSTAEQLFDAPHYEADSLFREMEMQIIRFPLPPMPISWWKGMSRGLWFTGLNDREVESFKEARRRMKNVATMLDELSNQKGRIVMVAHGWTNQYVAKYLKRMGWTVEKHSGRDYLGGYKLSRLP